MTSDDLARLRSLAEAAIHETIIGKADLLALLDAAALGLAWNRVEAALAVWSEGARFRSVELFSDLDDSSYGATATRIEHREPDGPPAQTSDEEASGPSPTVALLALAARLEARDKPG